MGSFEKHTTRVKLTSKAGAVIRKEPENFWRPKEKKKRKRIALQRSHHFVSRLVSWSGSSRRSQPGGSLPFDERFPTFPASTD